jgi:hypothetical protein
MRDILNLLGEPNSELSAIADQPNLYALIPSSIKQNPRIRRKIGWFIFNIRLSLSYRRLRSRLFFANDQKRSDSNVTLEASSVSQRMCILTETLTANQTTTLIKRCKAEQTSVHAAICVMWLRAFASQLEGRKSWTRVVSSPISMRERLSIPETSGLYLGSALTKINCSPQRDFWQVAREFKQKLNQACTDENLFLFPLMIGATFSQLPEKDLKDILPSLFNRPVKFDFSITNLGRVKIPAEIGRFKIESFYNLVNSSEHERTICVNTHNGRLTYSYLFRESKMDPKQAEELMGLVWEQLSKAIE